MKFTDFWNIYINEDITEHFPVFKEVFSQPLSEDIFEEYDVREVIFSFLDKYKKAKAFEQIEEFAEIVKDGNPAFFAKVSPFFHDVLVSYYCHTNKEDKLDWCIQDFVKDPLIDFDLLNKNILELLFFQQVEAVEKIVDASYKAVDNSGEYVSSAPFGLALIKYHQTLEKAYAQFLETQTFPWEEFKTVLSEFGFDPSDEFISNMEYSFRASASDIVETLERWFDENKNTAIEMLQKRFMMYMHQRGISFPVSGALWDHLYEYWNEHNNENSWDSYFNFEKETFKTFVKKRGGFIMDYRFQSAATLWGCCYIYDFLLDLKLIDEQAYENIKQELKGLRKELVGENLSDLWKYSFVHKWGKPDMDTPEEYEAEKELFDKYYKVDQAEARKVEKRGFFSSAEPTIWPGQASPRPKQKPIRKAKKIGRNEKVSVKYADGTVKRNVKYKLVVLDVEKGRCKLI